MQPPSAQPAEKPSAPTDRIGVLGAGLMGAGIAGAFVSQGYTVSLVDPFPQATEKGTAAIRRTLQRRVDAGRLPQDEMSAALARLTATADLSALADRDVVIEAIIEDEDAKTRAYQQLQRVCPPDAVLASNTSTISISRMARALNQPHRFAGMHFFNPVDRMALVEVIRGEQTGTETIGLLVQLAKRLGKTPVEVRDGPGFLVNRILFPYLNEALLLLQEGVPPRAVDDAATKFGMPMGPITLNDVVGLDTSLFASNVLHRAFPDRALRPRILDELVAAGRLGKKSGAGFYSYAAGTQGGEDPAFEAILTRCRTDRREVAAEELTDRLFLVMVVEASRVLAEDIVRGPGDVDTGMTLGTGFPSARGGLLRWADSVGMPEILRRLSRYEKLGRRFEPTEQMKRLAREGKGFYDAPAGPPSSS